LKPRLLGRLSLLIQLDAQLLERGALIGRLLGER
jgi:hypothetical protein